FTVIIEYLFLNFAWIVALSIPMAVLIGCLMSFGKLSADNEITAIKAGGIGLHKAISPLLILVSLIAFANYYFNDKILPELNYRAKRLSTNINMKNPSLVFKEGIISSPELIPNYRLQFKEIEENSDWVYGVTIFDYSDPNFFRTYIAEKAIFKYDETVNKISLDMYNGEGHEVDQSSFSEYKYIPFERQMVSIDVRSTSLDRSFEGVRGDREKNIKMMRSDVETYKKNVINIKSRIIENLNERLSLDKPIPQEKYTFFTDLSPEDFTERSDGSGYFITKHENDEVMKKLNGRTALVGMIRKQINNVDYEKSQITKYLVEIHKKYALPVTCLVFVLIGVPLGVRAKSGGLAVGVGLSMLFFLIFWTFLSLGEIYADRGVVSPWLSMWLGNIVIGGFGVWLTRSMIYETKLIDLSKFNPIKRKNIK
ncbi:LptF/LptG family permease, partial [candidate division KSB1 bacterium]